MKPFGVLAVSYGITSVTKKTKILLPSKMSNGFDFKPNSSVKVLGNENASLNILAFRNAIFILTKNVFLETYSERLV